MMTNYKIKVKRDKLVKIVNEAYELGYKFSYGESKTLIQRINKDVDYSHVWLYLHEEDKSITWSYYDYYEAGLEREHIKVKFKEFCKLIKNKGVVWESYIR